jgi:hypothetical protein
VKVKTFFRLFQTKYEVDENLDAFASRFAGGGVAASVSSPTLALFSDREARL